MCDNQFGGIIGNRATVVSDERTIKSIGILFTYQDYSSEVVYTLIRKIISIIGKDLYSIYEKNILDLRLKYANIFIDCLLAGIDIELSLVLTPKIYELCNETNLNYVDIINVCTNIKNNEVKRIEK